MNKLRHIIDTSGKPVVHVAREAGLSRAAIYLIINGQRKPQMTTIMALSRALGVEPQEIWPQLSGADHAKP